jgi:hypothetical protein
MRRRGIGRPAQPSLVNTAARTAVVVGTASAVSNKAASNQAAKAQAAAPQPAPEVAPVSAPAPAEQAALSDDVYDQLKKLGELREAGILTDDEFQAKKTQILGL